MKIWGKHVRWYEHATKRNEGDPVRDKREQRKEETDG
jgi:hypothetical protein